MHYCQNSSTSISADEKEEDVQRDLYDSLFGDEPSQEKEEE
jgi:hypothetical protein